MLDFTPLLNVGAVGVVLAWFMVRLEKRLAEYELAQERSERALDRNSRAMMLLLLHMDNLAPQAKRQATALLREAGHTD